MKFIEDTHKYIDQEIEYTPVTYLIKSFQPAVDWDTIAAKKAKKEGITKEELLLQWEQKRDKAATRGTAFHKKMEDQYISQECIDVDGQSCKVASYETYNGVKEDCSLKLEDNTIYTEKMIWSNRYKVCGTADLIKVVNGKINVIDYKSNAKLDLISWRHPVRGPKRLLFPLEHLDDCNFNTYQLQLNCYMYMLLQQNRHLKMGKMEILHIIMDKQDNHIDTITYPIKNMQIDIRNMLEAFLRKK